MGFGSSIIVARLVTPRDFGIFGMAVAITTIINVLLQFGVSHYIMREREINRDILRSLFTVNSSLTLVYFVAIHVAALVCIHSRSPEVGHFLQLFSLWPLISMFESIPNALCAREMRFGVISAISFLKAFVMFSVTIVFAYLGFAYLSFAWASVISALVTATAYNVVCFRPDIWKPRFVDFKKLVHFGIDMVGVGGLSQLSARGGEMALGTLLGLTSLGLYTRASNLPTTIYVNVYGVSTNVVFSRLSRDFRERGSFHETYFRFMRLLLGVLWPAMLGVAVLAEPLVHVLYGSRWQSAALPLALLMCATAVTLAIGMSAEVFVLRHQTRKQAKLEAARAVLSLALFIGGALISLPMAAAAKLAEVLLAYLVYRRLMDDLVGGPKGALEAVYAEALLLSTGAIAPPLVLMIYRDWTPSVSLLEMFAAVASGMMIWCFLLVLRQHPIIEEAKILLRPITRRSAAVS